MYARFLKEAAAISADPRLADLSPKLTAIGDRWEDVAKALAQAADATHPAERLDDATAPMDEIADLEQGFWEALAKTVAG